LAPRTRGLTGKHEVDDDMLLSMHIPKTAGTSFRQALHERLGSSMLIAYRGQVRGDSMVVPFTGRLLERLAPQDQDTLRNYCREHDVACIHGHFTLQALCPVLPDAQCITFVRHPVGRLVSAYNHLFVVMPQAEGTTFEQFLERERSRNLYEQLGMLEHLDALAFIGITEQYDRSLRLLERKFPQLAPLKPEQANVSQGKRFTEKDLTPEQREQLLALNDADLEIYEAAVDWFEKECAAHGV
jgi:hypothetical protein